MEGLVGVEKEIDGSLFLYLIDFVHFGDLVSVG